MSSKPTLFNFSVAVFLAVSLAGCGWHGDKTVTGAPTSSPVASAAMLGSLEIIRWGPTSTKAGVVFNKQPDGGAALWIRVNQSLEGDAVNIEFAGVPLQGYISGDLVTAAVPASLYAKPGTFAVYVIANKGAQSMRSNSAKFNVE